MSDRSKVGFLEASEEEQLNRVRAWHAGGGFGKHLYEFLGLTQEEYSAWVEDSKNNNPLRSDLHYSDGTPADLFALADAERFQRMALSMNYDWTLKEAFKNWEEYSEDMNAGWMGMPKRPADIWITWLKYRGRKKYREKYLKLGETESQDERRVQEILQNVVGSLRRESLAEHYEKIMTQPMQSETVLLPYSLRSAFPKQFKRKFVINDAGDVELGLDQDHVLLINAGDEGICLDVWKGGGEEPCWCYHTMYNDMIPEPEPEPETEKSSCIWPHHVDKPLVVYDRESYDKYLSGEYKLPARCLCGSEVRYKRPQMIALSLDGQWTGDVILELPLPIVQLNIDLLQSEEDNGREANEPTE